MCNCYLQKQVSHHSALRVVRLTPVALGVYMYALLGLAVCVHGSVCSWASVPAAVLYTCPVDYFRKPSRSSPVQNTIVITETDTGLLILGYPEPFEPKLVHGLCSMTVSCQNTAEDTVGSNSQVKNSNCNFRCGLHLNTHVLQMPKGLHVRCLCNTGRLCG